MSQLVNTLSIPSGVDISQYYGDGIIKSNGHQIALGIPGNAAHLAQSRLIQPFFGFDNGTADTEIFSGAERAPQGVARNAIDGVEKLYIKQRVGGTSYGDDETGRIVEFDWSETGSIVNNNVFSGVIETGHQGLSRS